MAISSKTDPKHPLLTNSKLARLCTFSLHSLRGRFTLSPRLGFFFQKIFSKGGFLMRHHLIAGKVRDPFQIEQGIKSNGRSSDRNWAIPFQLEGFALGSGGLLTDIYYLGPR
ncbi:unnamed protein product, partial [Cuscuta europaea]